MFFFVFETCLFGDLVALSEFLRYLVLTVLTDVQTRVGSMTFTVSQGSETSELHCLILSFIERQNLEMVPWYLAKPARQKRET